MSSLINSVIIINYFGTLYSSVNRKKLSSPIDAITIVIFCGSGTKNEHYPFEEASP